MTGVLEGHKMSQSLQHLYQHVSTSINNPCRKKMETTSHWIIAMVNSEISVGTLRGQLRGWNISQFL